MPPGFHGRQRFARATVPSRAASEDSQLWQISSRARDARKVGWRDGLTLRCSRHHHPPCTGPRAAKHTWSSSPGPCQTGKAGRLCTSAFRAESSVCPRGRWRTLLVPPPPAFGLPAPCIPVPVQLAPCSAQGLRQHGALGSRRQGDDTQSDEELRPQARSHRPEERRLHPDHCSLPSSPAWRFGCSSQSPFTRGGRTLSLTAWSPGLRARHWAHKSRLDPGPGTAV